MIPLLGAAAGAVGKAVKKSKGGIGSMRRAAVKQRFQDMAQDQLVSDREKRGYEQQSLEAAKQAQLAQDIGQQRTSAAVAGGSPLLAGQVRSAAKDVGEASREAATKATSDANKLAAALRDQREAQTLAAGERLIASNKEDVAMGIDSALKVAEAGAQIAKLAGGA